MGVKNYKYVRWIVLVVAIGLVAYGIVSQDYMGVINKATRICFECVGIG